LLNAIVVFKSLVLFITLIIIYLGAARRLVRLGDICLKEYCTEMKCAIKNATQRVYMSKIIRPRRKKNVEQVEREAHLMQMYEAA